MSITSVAYLWRGRLFHPPDTSSYAGEVTIAAVTTWKTVLVFFRLSRSSAVEPLEVLPEGPQVCPNGPQCD
jgi:hypothetical protein